MPPALSETSITGGPSSAWKRVDDLAAIARAAVEARERQLGARERGSIRSSRLVHCENTSALCPSATAVSSASSSASTFDDVGARLAGHQRRVARGLAQAQQRLERLDHAAALAVARWSSATTSFCVAARTAS